MPCNNHSNCDTCKNKEKKSKSLIWAKFFQLRNQTLLLHTQNPITDGVKRAIKNLVLQTDWVVCDICTDKLSNEISFLQCGHINYHKECLDTWRLRNNTCPECRSEIIVFCNIEL